MVLFFDFGFMVKQRSIIQDEPPSPSCSFGQSSDYFEFNFAVVILYFDKEVCIGVLVAEKVLPLWTTEPFSYLVF